jgi:PAS domain S-box-containing protein
MIKFNFLSQGISDELEKKRISSFTNALMVITVLVVLLMSATKALLYHEIGANDYILWSLAGLITIFYLVSRKGKVRLAGSLYIISLWAFMTWLAWANDGVKDSTVVAYILTIIIAIYIAQPWQALAIGLLSIIFLWVFCYAEINHIIIPTADTALNYSIDLTVILILVIALIILNAKSNFLFQNRIKKEFEDRLKTEKNLQAREILYQTLFETANDAIFLMEENTFVDCNLKTTEIFGCMKNQIIGRTPVMFSPPVQPDGHNSEESATKKINAALSGDPQRFEWQHIRMDGSVFDAEVSLNRIELNSRILLLAIVRDITERRKAEKALMKSEEKFYKAFNSSPNVISIVNLTQGGKIVEVNNTFEQKTGFKRNEVLGRNPVELGIFTNSGLYKELVEILNTGKSIREIEFEFQGKSGEVGTGLISIDLILLDHEKYALSTAVDITERKRAEKALIDSEKNFRSIFDKSRNGILIMRPDMRILAANQTASDLSGFVLGKDPLFAAEIIFPDQINKAKERIAQLTQGERLSPFEYKVTFKDGNIHIIEAESSIMEYYGQNAVLVMLRDVTQIRNAEHRVMEAILNTEENERSRIAQDLHDGLGPLLSTIKLYFNVYQDSTDEAKTLMVTEKLKNTIDEAIKGISEISHNISPHVLRSYGFYAALKQFIHSISLTNVVNISLECKKEPEVGQNTGIVLYRAITELINNSLKHSGCSNIAITCCKDENLLRINYADDGRGFDMASVIEKSGPGSGMQSIINRVAALQGTVDIRSSEGHGVKARIELTI